MPQPPVSDADLRAIEEFVRASAPPGASVDELDQRMDAAVARHVRENRGILNSTLPNLGRQTADAARGLIGMGNTAVNSAIGVGRALAGGEQATQQFLANDPGVQGIKTAAQSAAGLASGVGNAVWEGVKHGELPWEGAHGLAAGYKNPQIRGIAEEYAGRYGSTDKLKDMLYERPLDLIGDASMVAGPAFEAAGAAANAANLPKLAAVARGAELATNPFEAVSAGAKGLARATGRGLDNAGFGLNRMSMGLSKGDAMSNPLHQQAIETQRANNYFPTASGAVKRMDELEAGQAKKAAILAGAESRGVEAPNWQHNQRRQVGEYQALDANSPARATAAENSLRDFTNGQATTNPTTVLWPNTQVGPLSKPGPNIPKTHLALSDNNALLNDAANQRNALSQFGMETEPMTGAAAMADARWKDLREAQDYALPSIVPVNDALSDLHSWIGTVKAKRLRQGDAFSAYPSPKAQAANIFSRGLGGSEAALGHTADAIGSKLSQFGNTANSYTSQVPRAVGAGGLLETVQNATDEDERREAARAALAELRGVRF